MDCKDFYLAHINRDTGEEQSVSSHVYNTGVFAGEFLRPVGLEQTGVFSGGSHDIGKFKQEFMDYICSNIGSRGTVNHTFAAVRWLLSEYHQDKNCVEYIVAEILAIATGSHHGLYDAISPEGRSGFSHRMHKQGIGYEEVMCNLAGYVDEMRHQFQASVQELEPILLRIKELAGLRGDCSDDFYDGEVMFYTGLLSRFILSAVVDADRRDTAIFMKGVVYPRYLSDEAMDFLWKERLLFLEAKLDAMPNNTPIEKARREISDICRRAADLPQGVFRLCVNVGGGKTLSGLRFALAHAYRHHLRRLVFTAPLLTIIDQNADAMRKSLPEDTGLLECHSNVTNFSNRSVVEHALLSEGWDAQVIVTTAVQFLELLFSSDMDAIRRMHSLGGSVIVLDEIQAVPVRFLTVFSMAINFLSYICKASVVLCSATQPCLQAISHSVCVPVHDIPVPEGKYKDVFRRTNLIYRGAMDTNGVVSLADECLDKFGSVIVFCNTKRQAAELSNAIQGFDAKKYHISAGMCHAHRDLVLKEMRADLAAGERVICVSTRVLEAGVDISFGSGICYLSGLDHLIQQAGRINRNGELGVGNLAPVYIIRYQDEDLRRLPDMRMEQAAVLELFTEFDSNPDVFDNRLDSKEAIEYYYKALYKLCDASGLQDYPLASGGTLYDLLSANHTYCKEQTEQYFRQAFATAAKEFTVFGRETVDVIVDYGAGKDLILKLNSQKAHDDLRYAKQLLKKAGQYSVSVFRNTLDELGSEVMELPGGALGICEHYDSMTGFSIGVVDGMQSLIR